MAANDVFAALADPTRRAMVESLATEPSTATRLASSMPISRQAVAKHLALLREAELLDAERVGRETVYTLRPGSLGEVSAWARRVGGLWDERLARLERSTGTAWRRGQSSR